MKTSTAYNISYMQNQISQDGNTNKGGGNSTTRAPLYEGKTGTPWPLIQGGVPGQREMTYLIRVAVVASVCVTRTAPCCGPSLPRLDCSLTA